MRWRKRSRRSSRSIDWPRLDEPAREVGAARGQHAMTTAKIAASRYSRSRSPARMPLSTRRRRSARRPRSRGRRPPRASAARPCAAAAAYAHRRLRPVRRALGQRASSPKRAANAPPAASSSSVVPCSTTRPSTSTATRSATPASTGAARRRAPSVPRARGGGARRGPLGDGVDGRERVVEHEDARVGDQGARERHALALAAREVDAALADRGVVPARQVVDEVGDAGGLAGREHLVPRRSGRARVRFSRSVAENSTGRCVTMATALRSSATRSARASTPPTRTRPRGRRSGAAGRAGSSSPRPSARPARRSRPARARGRPPATRQTRPVGEAASAKRTPSGPSGSCSAPRAPAAADAVQPGEAAPG